MRPRERRTSAVNIEAFSRFDPRSLFANALDPIALSNTRMLFSFAFDTNVHPRTKDRSRPFPPS